MNGIKWLFGALLLTISAVQAECPPRFQGVELPEGKYLPLYNAPACVDVNGENVHIWASFTYWNVYQQNMEVAFVPPVTAVTEAAVVPGSVVAMGNHWSPGYKVGAACKTDYDEWVAFAEYTWIRSATSVSAANETGNAALNLSSTQLFPSDLSLSATSIQSKWFMHLDQIDVALSRPYYQGIYLIANPFLGMRGLFIRERQSGDATTTAGPNSVVLKSKCWSVGPVGGISGQWLLGKGVRFEGSSAASLLYTRYNELSCKFAGPNQFPAHAKQNNLNAIRPVLELGMGMGWGSYIYNHSYFLDFSIDYQFKYYWSQNMMRTLSSLEALWESNFIGALMIHGLVVTGKFDF